MTCRFGGACLGDRALVQDDTWCTMKAGHTEALKNATSTIRKVPEAACTAERLATRLNRIPGSA